MRKRTAAAVAPAPFHPPAPRSPGAPSDADLHSFLAGPVQDEPPPGPPTPPPRTDVPAHVSVDAGVVFVKCPDCGAVQGTGALVRKDGMLLCRLCNGNVDPDGELTHERIEQIRAQTTQRAAPPPAPAPTPTCAVCDKPATETTIGLVYPCDHGKGAFLAPSPTPPAPKPSAPQKAASPVPATPIGPPSPKTPPTPLPVPAKPPSPPPVSPPPAALTPMAADAVVTGETVTVTFGEETFSPRPYNTIRLGPYTHETRVRVGETPADAAERAMAHLRAFAAIEFQRKMADFLAHLDQLGGRS